LGIPYCSLPQGSVETGTCFRRLSDTWLRRDGSIWLPTKPPVNVRCTPPLHAGDAMAVKVDVGDPASVAEMMSRAISKYGQIDYAFCGAGVMDRVAVIEMPEQVWDRLMRINLKGVFLCAQAAAKHMIPRKEGRILSIASGRGVAGAPRSAHYAASKAGVIAFTKSLAVELAPDNITVNCVCPGATDTPMSRIGFTPEQFKKREEIPPLMDGLTHKFEIVGLVRYLLSDATKFVTGQTFFLRTPK